MESADRRVKRGASDHLTDMCKAMDRGMVIGDICLVEKRGGKSGIYRREDECCD